MHTIKKSLIKLCNKLQIVPFLAKIIFPIIKSFLFNLHLNFTLPISIKQIYFLNQFLVYFYHPKIAPVTFKINSVNAEWCNIQSCINCLNVNQSHEAWPSNYHDLDFQ
ncbi:hypothetical protein BpHYR1_042614 [Brachionus plicatilis]|uniref:Uncharacterized protein n=1 Tax=Brachionus plicatilis TaxID=10195 RepID=A0A3M7QPB5_BRAPC|nr:hypothetical protein BpHYR1_042614 [Brachionus plicatilis]